MPRKPTPARSLLRLFDAVAAPLYVLDAERQIVYGNAAFAAWTGKSIEELLGLRCNYHASGQIAGLSELAAALCPPPEAFLGRRETGSVACPAADGKLVPRPAQFVPLAMGDAGPVAVLTIVDLLPQSPAPPAVAAKLSPEQLHLELQRLRSELGRRFHLSQFVGQTTVIRQVREQIRLAAEARTRVVVVGPQGSGCEHVAKTIHYNRRSAAVGPLVPIDCRLVDAELMQATLASFLKRQAEIPADRAAAVLLLEVDKLSAEAQQELAGFLLLPGIQLSTIATSRTRLPRLAQKGKFRRDLAYALSTLAISLPPLRQRSEDVPLLAQFFLEEFNARGGKQLSGFAAEAIDKLAMYEWPGNLDEFEQLSLQACEQARGPEVLADDLPDRLHHAARAVAHARADNEQIRLDDYLAEIERELLQRALRRAKGNKTRAAELLGIHRARLIRRLVQLGLAAPPQADEPIDFVPLPDEE